MALTQTESFVRVIAALKSKRTDPARKDADPARKEAEYEVHHRHFVRILEHLRKKIYGVYRGHLDSAFIADTAIRSLLKASENDLVVMTGWEDMWGLLVCIADRKLYKQVERANRAKRDVRRNAGAESLDWTPAQADDPAMEAAANEVVQEALAALTTDRQRQAIKLLLDGRREDEIAEQVGRDKRMVFRYIAEFRATLERLMADDSPSPDAEPEV